MDKRIEKTKKVLQNTLFALLTRKKLSEISVKEICEESLVSRITFYTHFEDKYDLLDYSAKQVSQDIYKDFLKEYDQNKNQSDIPSFLTNFTLNIIELCFENKIVLNRLYENEGIERTIISSCISKMVNDIFNKTIEKNEKINSEKKKHIISFFIGGLTYLINDLFEENNLNLEKLYDAFYYFYNVALTSFIKTYYSQK